MNDRIETTTEVDIRPFLDFLSRNLLVRYMLTYDHCGNQSLRAEILSAPGLARECPEYVLSMSFHSYGDHPSTSRLSDQKFSPRDAAMCFIAEHIGDWSSKSKDNNAPWFEAWMAPAPFVGLVMHTTPGREKYSYRTLPPDSPHFLFYHGLLAAKLGAATEDVKVMGERRLALPGIADAYRRLTNQFDAFTISARDTFNKSIVGSA